nr:hypothetical protein BSM_21880 [uncultured archaeon]
MSLLPNSFYTLYYLILFEDDKGASLYFNASKKCQHVSGFLNDDVCMELFNRIKHLETESSTLIYDITSTYFLSAILHIWLWHCRYKHHLGVAGCASVEDSLDEQGRIRKITLDFGGESSDKISNFPFPLFESFPLFLRRLPLDSKLHYSLLREETFGKYLWSCLNLEHRVSRFSEFCVRFSTLVPSGNSSTNLPSFVSKIYLKVCGDPAIGSVRIILILALLLTRSSRSLFILLSGQCGELFLFSLQLSDVTFAPLLMSKLLTAKKRKIVMFKELKSDIIQ